MAQRTDTRTNVDLASRIDESINNGNLVPINNRSVPATRNNNTSVIQYANALQEWGLGSYQPNSPEAVEALLKRFKKNQQELRIKLNESPLVRKYGEARDYLKNKVMGSRIQDKFEIVADNIMIMEGVNNYWKGLSVKIKTHADFFVAEGQDNLDSIIERKGEQRVLRPRLVERVDNYKKIAGKLKMVQPKSTDYYHVKKEEYSALPEVMGLQNQYQVNTVEIGARDEQVNPRLTNLQLLYKCMGSLDMTTKKIDVLIPFLKQQVVVQQDTEQYQRALGILIDGMDRIGDGMYRINGGLYDGMKGLLHNYTKPNMLNSGYSNLQRGVEDIMRNLRGMETPLIEMDKDINVD